MCVESIRAGVQAAVRSLRHRRQPGSRQAGDLHAGWRDPPQDHLPIGGRGRHVTVRPTRSEHERRSVHHKAATRAPHVPHQGPSRLLRRGRRHRVPNDLHRLHRRLCLPLLRAL